MRRRREGDESLLPAVSDPAGGEENDKSIVPTVIGQDWNLRSDGACVILLAIAGILTRFYQIGTPQSVVWDESHFTKFLTWYFTQHYFVDIHPPLAKLVFAFALSLTGFKGAEEYKVEWWTDRGFIGTSDWQLLYNSKHGAPYAFIRCMSAGAGVVLVVAAFLAARAMGSSRWCAVLAAWLVLFDNLIALQSRLILTDVFLYMFNMLAYGAAFMAGRGCYGGTGEVGWTFITGLMLGCAFSVKFTAIGTIGMVGVYQVMCLWDEYLSTKGATSLRLRKVGFKVLWKGTLMLGTAIVVALAFWVVHIAILPYDGQGTGFMNTEFQETLSPKLPPEYQQPEPDACPNHLNSWSDCGYGGITKEECEAKGCCHDPTSPRNWCYHRGTLVKPTMSWPAKITEVLRASWANNEGEGLINHPFMSEWWEWPVMRCRAVPFGSVGRQGKLFLLGNLAVWWTVFATFCCAAIWLIVHSLLTLYKSLSFGVEHSNPTRSIFLALMVGYVGNIVPYMLIPRSKFIYHYIPALEVGILLTAFCIDWLFKRSRNSLHTWLVAGVYFVVMALVIAGFVYWSPWTYGFPLSTAEHRQRKWITKWNGV